MIRHRPPLRVVRRHFGVGVPFAALAILLPFGMSGCAGASRERPTGDAVADRDVTLGRWSTLGHSVEGRPIEVTTIGRGPKRCLFIGGIHGDEPEGLVTIDDAMSVADAHGERWTTTIVRDMNPDGTARRSRRNARGVDLNRNWPATNFTHRAGGARSPSGHPAPSGPLSEPESDLVYGLIERTRPELVLVLHSSGSGPFVNFDGPAEEAARHFAEAASSAGRSWRVEPSMGYPTPGSLGSLVGVDRAIAILTIEFRRGAGDDGRHGASQALRRGFDAVLTEVGRTGR